MKTSATWLAAAAALGLVTGAHAQSFSANGVTAEEFASWMQTQGFAVSVEKNADTPSPGSNDKMVLAADGGVKYLVFFYGCEQGRCFSVQLAAL